MLMGAVIYAKDMNALVPFYLALGFQVVQADDSFTQLSTANSELTLIQAPQEIAANITLSAPAAARSETPVKLVFLVASIERTADEINRTGGRVDRGQHRWDFGEYFVQDAVDPEGNIIQLRELKTTHVS
jgi:predicted enzyme related to lactoylglutathione lyase